MKKKYTCINCQTEFERYASTVRHEDKVCCSKKCWGEFQSISNTGTNNANYKHGNYVNPVCECGKTKDPRSLQCSKCAKKSKGVGVDKVVSDDIIIDKVSECKTLSELASTLGTSRYWISNRVKELNIDLSHFQRSAYRPWKEDEILVENSIVGQNVLRYFILSNDLIEYICCECGNTGEWMGKDIILELHHINGNNKYNKLDNLVFLCPNCHTQTKSYRGKKNE